MASFIDIERPIKEEYSAIVADETLNTEKLKEKLEGVIEKDPDFLDARIALYGIAQNEEDYQEADVILNRAYDKALGLVLDEKDNFPESLSWEHETNQHIIRVLFHKSLDFWMEEMFSNAREILGFLNYSNKKFPLGFDIYLYGTKDKIEYETFITDYFNQGKLTEKGESWFAEHKKHIKA